MKAQLLLVCVALAGTLCAAQTMVGGISGSQGVSGGAEKAADMALVKLNEDHGLRSSLGSNVGSLKLVRIKDVRTQVVAGINYFITMTVADSNGREFDMDATIWARPWLEGKNSGEEAYKVTKVERLDA